MLESVKPPQRLGHRLRRGAGDGRGRRRGEDVAEHVAASQLHRGERDQPLRARGGPLDDPLAINDEAVRDPARQRERHAPREDAGASRGDAGIVGVDHRPVVGGLIGKDAGLGRSVGLDARMPVQMVVREIEPGGNPRPERGRRLELEAARFHNVERLCGRRLHLRAQGHPDVAAHEHVPAGRRQHPAQERRRGRLPFRAGNGQHPPSNPPRRELELPDDFNASLACRVEDRLLDGNARAHDHEIRGGEGVPAVTAKLQLNACGPQPVRRVYALAHLGQRHERAPLRKQFRRRDAAAGGADHHHATLPDREVTVSHAITAASMSSG